MIDFAKKIRKSCSEHLLPGEEVLAGTFVQPAGAFRRQVAMGAVGGLIGAAPGEAMAKKRKENSDATPGEGMSIDIPAGKAVLGLTPQRLLVFGHSTMSGKPKGLNAAIPLDEVKSISLEQGKLMGKLLVTFHDDSSIDFDVQKTVKPGPFVDAFHTATGR